MQPATAPIADSGRAPLPRASGDIMLNRHLDDTNRKREHTGCETTLDRGSIFHIAPALRAWSNSSFRRLNLRIKPGARFPQFVAQFGVSIAWGRSAYAVGRKELVRMERIGQCVPTDKYTGWARCHKSIWEGTDRSCRFPSRPDSLRHRNQGHVAQCKVPSSAG
jgi:hypothetical protein